MSRIETRLDELGLTLPAALVPPGNFQLVKIHDGLTYIAGHGPFDGPTPLVQELVGRDLNAERLGFQYICSLNSDALPSSIGEDSPVRQNIAIELHDRDPSGMLLGIEF